jgi:hypothetical protein
LSKAWIFVCVSAEIGSFGETPFFARPNYIVIGWLLRIENNLAVSGKIVGFRTADTTARISPTVIQSPGLIGGLSAMIRRTSAVIIGTSLSVVHFVRQSSRIAFHHVLKGLSRNPINQPEFS